MDFLAISYKGSDVEIAHSRATASNNGGEAVRNVILRPAVAALGRSSKFQATPIFLGFPPDRRGALGSANRPYPTARALVTWGLLAHDRRRTSVHGGFQKLETGAAQEPEEKSQLL
jgi:hypothetical protein